MAFHTSASPFTVFLVAVVTFGPDFRLMFSMIPLQYAFTDHNEADMLTRSASVELIVNVRYGEDPQ